MTRKRRLVAAATFSGFVVVAFFAFNGVVSSYAVSLLMAHGGTDGRLAARALATLFPAPYVPDSATLMARSTVDYAQGIWRDDYAAGFGAPPVFYLPSDKACSLNGGNGDNGSQVKSSNGSCWVARLESAPHDVRIWGASPGSADSNAAITAALAAGPVTGSSLTYGVSGSISLPPGTDLSNITLTQLSAGSNTRTLFASSGDTIRLKRVKVNMNAAGNVGRVGKSAGIYIANVAFPRLGDVEVYGGGVGFGIAVTDCKRAEVVNPYVHDMQWQADVDPLTEQIFGIVFIRCSNVTVVNPRIYNLTGVIGANPPRAYQTDGMGFGGVTHATVKGGTIDTVGEGTDTFSSLLTTDLWLYGTVYRNIDSHAVKFGSIRHSGTVGIRCYDAGLDCVTTGANSTTPPGYGAAHIRFTDTQAFDTGSNGLWGNPTGFTLNYDGTPGVQPVDIQCIDCKAIDTKGRMKFGFLADPGTTFILTNPFAAGYTAAAFHRDKQDAELPAAQSPAENQ